MYDKTAVYHSKIQELATKLRQLCYENKIPMFLTFAVKDDGKETAYESEMVSAGVLELKLAQNKVAGMANVLNGFSTVPSAQMDELDFVLDEENQPEKTNRTGEAEIIKEPEDDGEEIPSF